MIDRFFRAHPRSVGENYLEHQRHAWGFAARLLGASGACLIHGIFPFLFERTASNMVVDLHTRMTLARGKRHTGADGQQS